MNEQIRTHSTPYYCSAFIFWKSIGGAWPMRAAAEASMMGDNWWVNRVVVQPESERDKGVGGRLLEALKGAVAKSGGMELLVVPGGYNPDMYVDQVRFYKKHGFEEAFELDRGVYRVGLSKEGVGDG